MRGILHAPARALFSGLCSLFASACAELPELPANACGNGVIEAGEDCDTFAVDESFVCRPKGSPGACRFDCSLNADNERSACPAGWGCDGSGLCREPTGNFSAKRSYDIGPVAELVTGDFDGDGRFDIVSREPTDGLDHGKIAFHFFDERGNLAETHAFPKLLTSPALLDLSGDQRSDLVFSDYRVGMLLGRKDRRLVPETFSSYRLPDTQIRMVGVLEGYIRTASSLVVFGTFDGVSSFSEPDSTTGRLRSLGELPGRIEDTVSDPVAGNIIEDEEHSPCAELVVAMRGATSFLLFDTCERDSKLRDVIWREQAQRMEIPLMLEAAIDGPAQIVDMNGDRHLDVLIGAAGQAYVAYGDGASLRPAVPFSVTVLDFNKTIEQTGLPLAAGDYTGDGAVDFVFEDRLVVSVPRFGGGAPSYEVGYATNGAAWTVARIAELNGIGKIGVVAASRTGLGIDVFNGTGNRYLTPTRIATSQPVHMLEVGDFDGDLTNDVAFAEYPEPDETHESLSISFGSIGRPPGDPLPVGRLQNPDQLAVYRTVSRGHLAVASHLEASNVGVLTLLDGTPDRVPFAPYPLVSFSEDGNLQDYPAIAVLAGAFSAPGHGDVIAIGSFRGGHDFWFVQDLEQGQNTPIRLLGGALDASLVPVADQDTRGRLQLASAAVDLDHDGRDEALWAMPNEAQHCTILSFAVDASSAPTLIPRGSLELSENCQKPELATFDVDADGAPDILLLSGQRAAEDRKLSVLWNDGQGGFSAREMTQVNGARDLPEAFAAVPETTARPLSIVYVTEHAAFLTGVLGARRFDAPHMLTTLEQGRGVAASDINGDGASDLVFADGGKLTILLAELKTP
jgi:hypothetical protein